MQALNRIWSTLSSSNKLVLTFFAAATVVASLTLVMVASRPDYTVLFSNLKPEDASTIVESLREARVDYRITANGTAIEVPSKDVYEVRLTLAGKGLPQGGSIGFEIFDKNSLGVTDFAQKTSYQRALQGELQRSIMSLSQVADARVHIVMPDDSLYSEEKKEASASVMVNLRGGGRLSEEEVASITNLVSAAVEGLTPERVTVVDTKGNLLADGSGRDSAGLKLSATQFAIKESVEKSVQRKVETMLQEVAGPGAAVVRVNADLSFDHKETSREMYEPTPGQQDKQGVLSSQEKMTEYYGGPGAAQAGGVPGTASNLSPRPQSAPQEPGQGYRREQTTARYEVSRSVEKVQEAPGTIRKLTVAVMVDKAKAGDKVLSIRNAVMAAAGADPQRDSVVVESVEFPKAQPEAKPALAASLGNYVSMGRNALAMVLLAVFVVMVKSAIARQSSVLTEALATAATSLPAHQMGLPADGSEAGEVPAPYSNPQLVKKTVEEMGLPLQSAQEAARQHPEDIAVVVRSWMSEDAKAA